MSKNKETARQIRMSDSLWRNIGAIAKELEIADERGVHSLVIREMISAAVAKWRHSPYVCREARHVVLVTEQGNIFYRLVQLLKLNSEREKLPCFLEMKPEKRSYYAQSCPQGELRGDWFRSRWLLNYFGVWKGNFLEKEPSAWGEPVAYSVDRTGASTKMADLPVNEDSGRFLTREVIVGLKDYVQWMEPGKLKYDRMDLPIDIPTRNLSVAVVVDEELYKHKRVGSSEISDLDVEFRNRELARFASKELAFLPENPMTETHGRFHGDDDDDSRPVREQIQALISRVKQLQDQLYDGQPIISGESQRRDIDASLRQPNRFLFCDIEWLSPHFGIEFCVRWEKPLSAA